MLHFFSIDGNVIFGNSNVKPVDLWSFEESPESSASENNTTTSGLRWERFEDSQKENPVREV